MKFLCALLAALTGFAAISSAQPSTRLYPIAGVVTDSASGEPVAGVTMQLYAGQPRQLQQTTQTDTNGQFAMQPVPPGKYSLRAMRRGYVAQTFNEHFTYSGITYSSAIVTGPDQDTANIPFHMYPGAVLRGYVTDDEGEAAESAHVLVVVKTNEIGLGEHLHTIAQVDTDDQGLFEIWNLRPGSYFLAVKANPWFALPMPMSALPKDASEEDRAAVAALDVAYPVTYYDGATEEDAATAIELKSGDSVRADITLHAVPAMHLTASIPEGNSGNWYASAPHLRQTILGNDSFAGNSATMRPTPGNPGELEFSGIAPGRYTVLQGNPPRATELNVTGDQQTLSDAGEATYAVELKLRMADGSAVPQPLNLGLLSENQMHSQQVLASAPGEASFASVLPGEWNLIAGGTGIPAMGIVSIQAGSAAPRAGGRVVVKDRSLTLNVVLAQGKTNVEGFATRDGKPAAGMMIVLAPRNSTARMGDFRRDQTDSDGSFALLNVVPGEYTIVAIEDGWDLDWATPEVIGRYLKDGIAVSVPPGAPATLRLSTPVPVQQK